MRHVTEANAKLIEEVMEQAIAELKAMRSSSLRVANRIRLMGIALHQLQNSKTTNKKNGIESKKG